MTMGLCFAYDRITLEGCQRLFDALGGDEAGASMAPDADTECVYGYVSEYTFRRNPYEQFD